jgi:hypothetical protein
MPKEKQQLNLPMAINYIYQNVPLPEKYGTVPPQQWQAQWIPEKPNDKVRKVLEQVIRSNT